MFVRGGVYRVVKEAMGSTLAKFSVSALMFDYILTGPISGVSAGQYIVGLINETAAYFHIGLHITPGAGAAFFACLCTGYFWWLNIKGVHESSQKAMRIMQITTVMVIMLIAWCLYTGLDPPSGLAAISYAAQPEAGAQRDGLALWRQIRPHGRFYRHLRRTWAIPSWP